MLRWLQDEDVTSGARSVACVPVVHIGRISSEDCPGQEGLSTVKLPWIAWSAFGLRTVM